MRFQFPLVFLICALLPYTILILPTTASPAPYNSVRPISLFLHYLPLLPKSPPSPRTSSLTLFSSRSSDPAINCSSPGFNFEPCTTEAGCISPRTCFDPLSDGPCPDTPDSECICAAELLCKSSADCGIGEVCASDGNSRQAICFSRKLVRPGSLTLRQLDGGLTWDSCFDDSVCQQDRVCRVPQVEPPACNGEKGCVCSPTGDFFCNSHDDCVEGEVCTMADYFDEPLCVSRIQVNCRPNLFRFDEFTAPPSTTATATTAATTSATVTDSDTATTATQTDSPAPTQATTTSMPTTVADSSTSAADATTADSASSATTTAAPATTTTDSSNSTSTSTAPVSSTVCIDAALLHHLHASELVFRSHVHARVLCDATGSCATPGHMVVYDGRAMMMRRYCALMGCVERVRLVNSPRYRRRWRGLSRTEGLAFTAFAARWESAAEEHILAAVVRVGL